MRTFYLMVLLAIGLSKVAVAQNESSITSDYVLQHLDLLRIVVFQEPDLERQVRISQESTINLPLIGIIDLTGKSVRQAEETLRALYDADFLRNPQITITVLEYSQRTVQVLGAVNQPGAIAFIPEQPMGIVEAIARAGGPSRLAEKRRIRLTRQLPDGRTETVTVNIDEILQGNSSERWLLKKGDVIFVPERLL
ncbi:MAG: polysaccharide biosynthesis/export family protein [Candidatus Didemnitutus sp.]|nr:polysaccharide biosynthesis/export family protein [Candidatus Didemnitutus sp.]